MTPTMPLVEESGQLEVTASVQPSARLEAMAAYSPLNHVVLTGAGSVGLNLGGRQYLRTQQGELGIGGYWSLGNSWLVNAAGGGGLASVDRKTCVWGCDQRKGQYSKLFGQAGIAWIGVFGSASLTYRLSRLQYTGVTNEGNAISDFGTYRHELALATRRYLGWSDTWFWQYTMGVSLSNLKAPGELDSAAQTDRWFSAGVPTPFLGIGIGWQPFLRSRR
ncbi:hypothetical protein KBK19_12630 [Microvirga sp. STR05]|uniref:DUF3575 domain-containing protein n=1 Tax=Hymenobacter duratus TaxID=2771356 RepID=A0ABR8JG94_9BACT|nr:hypothetical protein [Hymenobacter duratus]MBD2715882.1 hypothetical protein [Hymenobacter duratus]MBR7950794.1 hypothetical protein [Microvirga sp. STR05]